MIFTALGGIFTLGLGYYFVGAFSHEDTGELFKVVDARAIRGTQETIRRRKTVITAAEMKKLDPTFILPHIPSIGEPDI